MEVNGGMCCRDYPRETCESSSCNEWCQESCQGGECKIRNQGKHYCHCHYQTTFLILVKGNIFNIMGRISLFFSLYSIKSVKSILNFKIYFIMILKFINLIKYNKENRLKLNLFITLKIFRFSMIYCIQPYYRLLNYEIMIIIIMRIFEFRICNYLILRIFQLISF